MSKESGQQDADAGGEKMLEWAEQLERAVNDIQARPRPDIEAVVSQIVSDAMSNLTTLRAECEEALARLNVAPSVDKEGASVPADTLKGETTLIAALRFACGCIVTSERMVKGCPKHSGNLFPWTLPGYEVVTSSDTGVPTESNEREQA
jgi:hypothetical protein